MRDHETVRRRQTIREKRYDGDGEEGASLCHMVRSPGDRTHFTGPDPVARVEHLVVLCEVALHPVGAGPFELRDFYMICVAA